MAQHNLQACMQIAQGGIDPPVKKKISHRAAAWPLVGKVSSASLKGLSPGVPKVRVADHHTYCQLTYWMPQV